MSKTILVCGFGPGISAAVAEKFATEGFSVGLVARNKERIDRGVRALESRGRKAHGFAADVTGHGAMANVVAAARVALGPVTAIHWNAYSGAAGDLLQADRAQIDAVLGIATSALLDAVRAALPDLRAQKGESAVLVTNGLLAHVDPAVDKMAVDWNVMGLAVANAAKHKLVGLLAHRLAADGVFVGEVIVNGIVKGSAFDNGRATLEPSRIAAAFWDLYRARSQSSIDVS
jgi:NADP-dependent 3-hydroxy acid dehydrogenase YdfG